MALLTDILALQNSELAGVESEYQLIGPRGPIDFRDLIHSLDLDGARLDPGDAFAYRLRTGVVLTADGAAAEVAIPPEPLAPGFADTLTEWQNVGLRELTSVLPPRTKTFGYSTHISVSVPDQFNDELCQLYAHTFGPALMFLMNSIGTEGIYIRPRPGRIEFCGAYLSGDRLKTAAAFAVGSVRACEAYLRGSEDALGDIPRDLQVELQPDPIRFGWQLTSACFQNQESQTEADLLLSRPASEIRLSQLLQQSWQATRPFLPRESDSEPSKFTASALPSPDASGQTATSRQPASSASVHDSPALGIYGAILADVVRPDFSVSARVAVWDFTIFKITGGSRTAYACVPRPLLSAFWDQLARGQRDAELGDYLRGPSKSGVLAENRQTSEFGLWDDLVVSQRLLRPERLPYRRRPLAGLLSRIRPAARSAGRPFDLFERGAPDSRQSQAGGSGSLTGINPTSEEESGRPGKRPPPGGRLGKISATPSTGGIKLPLLDWRFVLAPLAVLLVIALAFAGGLFGSGSGASDTRDALATTPSGVVAPPVAVDTNTPEPSPPVVNTNTPVPPSAVDTSTPEPPPPVVNTSTPEPPPPVVNTNTPVPACLLRTNLNLLQVIMTPGGYQGNIQVVVTDGAGTPVEAAIVSVANQKSDGTSSTADGATNSLGRVIFGVVTTAPGVSTLTVTNVQKDPCVFDPANSETEKSWQVVAPATPSLSLSCEHKPGEFSDLIIRGTGFTPGELVAGQVTGPGVIGNGFFVPTVAVDGTFEARVPFEGLGNYTVNVPPMPLEQIAVGAVCPG